MVEKRRSDRASFKTKAFDVRSKVFNFGPLTIV
jgi:hypothetical protein